MKAQAFWEGAVRAIFLILNPILDQAFWALSDHFWYHFWPTIWQIFGPLLEPILEPALAPDRTKNSKMSPKQPTGSSKNKKHAFSKTLKNPQFFIVFWIKRPPKKTSRDPKRLPRQTQRSPKPPTNDSKIDPKNWHFLNEFWTIFWDQICTKNIKKTMF